MTILDKIGLYLAGALLCVGIGAFAVYQHNASEITDLKAQLSASEKNLAATNQALATKAKALKDLDTKYRARDKAVSNALQANPDWAGTAVPDAVYDSLFPSEATPAR